MPVPPSVLKFHPYDQQIAVAGENTFSILDWGTGARNTTYHNKSLRSSKNKITALEWINGHDISMLMIGVNDGSIKVFKPNIESGREPRLITAWQAFNEMKIGNSDLLLSWEQWSQTVITAGDSRVLRLWDAEKETKAFDIVTGTDSPVTCINSCFANTSNEHYASFIATNRDDPPRESEHEYPCRGFVAAGFENGSVRLFDRRCPPADNRVKDWMEHSQPILGLQLLDDNFVISASASGHVKLFDIRKNFSIDTQHIQEGISCFSIHHKAAIYACGGESQSLYIYNLQGRLINDIRFFDGFMAPRIGLINCLNFHPHKVILASGTADSLLSVHALESRR
ncbi:hypothetical protein WA026_010673 [Henosepilachna vigintioctopunctata]|uniref:Uncharacterized protein n=1 Tax=Henosepilachna vigintioctopunctata TaxID=420089 RepID=A0AAW1UVL1_9CUCU